MFFIREFQYIGLQPTDESIVLSTYVVDDDKWCTRASVIEYMKREYAAIGLDFDEFCTPNVLADGRKQYTLEQKQRIDDAHHEWCENDVVINDDGIYAHQMMSALICRFGKPLVKSKERWDFHISELYDIYKIINATSFENKYSNDITIMIMSDHECYHTATTHIQKKDENQMLVIQQYSIENESFMTVVSLIAFQMLSQYCGTNLAIRHAMQLHATIAPYSRKRHMNI